MNMHYDFLQAKYPCTRTHHATINVLLQEDVSWEVSNNMKIKQPVAFKLYRRVVGLSTLDKISRAVKEIYMVNSDDNGPVLALYNHLY